MSTVSTEGRIFAAQLTRDLAAREAAGAKLLTPNAKHWNDALHGFGDAVVGSGSPTKAARAFRAGIARLHKAQEEGACYVNSHLVRSRSGGFDVLTWEVAKHPLTNIGFEGVLIRGHYCLLQRNGCITVGHSRLAFCSWHALARIRERSKLDLFDARGIVIGCGLTGLLLRGSKKHSNTGIHYAAENLMCAGTLRVAADEKGAYHLFDVITAFELNEAAPQVAQWKQGCAFAWAVHKYIKSDDSDPTGYCDDIPVLPARTDDYVSRELKKVS